VSVDVNNVLYFILLSNCEIILTAGAHAENQSIESVHEFSCLPIWGSELTVSPYLKELPASIGLVTVFTSRCDDGCVTIGRYDFNDYTPTAGKSNDNPSFGASGVKLAADLHMIRFYLTHNAQVLFDYVFDFSFSSCLTVWSPA